MKEFIRIGNAQGFWGDSVEAPREMLEAGEVDYITLDYLAEVTMSIMQRQKYKDTSKGYATDFVRFVTQFADEITAKNIRIVASAGGVNAPACQQAILHDLQAKNIHDLSVGIVEGDDILHSLDELLARGAVIRNMENGESIEAVRDALLSANVYIASRSMADALDQGAQIVVAGRVSDPGLTLAPMLHEFNWKDDDYDLVAAGTVAGHILECGAQATGGNYSRWWDVPGFDKIAYPVVEAYPDGSMIITKTGGSGGMVTVDTIKEQILYELGDPKNYISPDVVVDFTTIKLEQAGKNRVRIWNISGRPPTHTYKVSASYLAGYKASGQLTVTAPFAVEKARKVAEIIWGRLENLGFHYEETRTEYQGINSCHQDMAKLLALSNEVVVRLSVRDHDRDKVERFGKEIAPLVTNGPAGVTGFAGGRPRPQEIISFWPGLIAKQFVPYSVNVKHGGQQ